MQHVSIRTPLRPIGVLAVAWLTAAAPVGADPQSAPAGSPAATQARGDLSGVWTNSSLTRLERAGAPQPLELDEAAAQRMEAQARAREASANAPTDPGEGAPTDGSIGGYNFFWLDPGNRLARINGAARTSWIVDPPSGRMPFSEAGRAKAAAYSDAARNDFGPESLNPADRCLIGSRGSGGPPMLNNIYNNTYRIVQTADHVMIEVEMMHDARIIRIGGDHKPAALEQWLGDSVGRWEGDTLVVETRHWKSEQGRYQPIFLSAKAKVTERFTRLSDTELLYRFEVDDPDYYSQVWSGEMMFTPASGEVYEYACHEGNYAMGNILRGARLEERRAGK
ncbi:hypothetical protein GC169_04265 [bacterium]|nr:hypothetical protein [bacterium]